MKIIKHGSTQKTCKRCGCIFEYDKSDISTREVRLEFDYGFMYPSYIKETWIIKEVKCPDCEKAIEIEAHEKR